MRSFVFFVSCGSGWRMFSFVVRLIFYFGCFGMSGFVVCCGRLSGR